MWEGSMLFSKTHVESVKAHGKLCSSHPRGLLHWRERRNCWDTPQHPTEQPASAGPLLAEIRGTNPPISTTRFSEDYPVWKTQRMFPNVSFLYFFQAGHSHMSEHITRKPVNVLYCSCNSVLSTLVCFILSCYKLELCSSKKNCFFSSPKRAGI